MLISVMCINFISFCIATENNVYSFFFIFNPLTHTYCLHLKISFILPDQMPWERGPFSADGFSFWIKIFSDPNFVPHQQDQIKHQIPRVMTPHIANHVSIFQHIESHVACVVDATCQSGNRELIQALHRRNELPGCFVVSWTLIGYNIFKYEILILFHVVISAHPNVERYIGLAWTWGWNKMNILWNIRYFSYLQQ